MNKENSNQSPQTFGCMESATLRTFRSFHKVRGVALFDALVGIILSSLVIVTVFMIMRNNFENYFIMGNVQERMMEENKLRYILGKDAFHAQTIAFAQNELILSNDSEVRYQFHSNCAVRRVNEQIDTIKVTLVDKDIIFDEELPELARQLRLVFKLGEANFSIHLSKNYPAMTYMKKEDEY